MFDFSFFSFVYLLRDDFVIVHVPKELRWNLLEDLLGKKSRIVLEFGEGDELNNVTFLEFVLIGVERLVISVKYVH